MNAMNTNDTVQHTRQIRRQRSSAYAWALSIALLVLLLAPGVANVMAAQDQCAQTAHMRIYLRAFVAPESGDLDGYELALEQRSSSAVRALLYVYEGAANDDGILLSGSLSGKKLILQGDWVERLTEYLPKRNHRNTLYQNRRNA
jgi:hypothetical protein